MQDAWIPLVTDLLAEGWIVLYSFAAKRKGKGTKGRSSASGGRALVISESHSNQLRVRARAWWGEGILDQQFSCKKGKKFKPFCPIFNSSPERKWVAHANDSQPVPGVWPCYLHALLGAHQGRFLIHRSFVSLWTLGHTPAAFSVALMWLWLLLPTCIFYYFAFVKSLYFQAALQSLISYFSQLSWKVGQSSFLHVTIKGNEVQIIYHVRSSQGICIPKLG